MWAMPLRGSVLRPSPLPDSRQANNQPDYCGGHRNDSSKMRQQAVRCREIGPANQLCRGADGERPWPAKTPKPCPARRRSGRNSAQEDQRMAGPFAFKTIAISEEESGEPESPCCQANGDQDSNRPHASVQAAPAEGNHGHSLRRVPVALSPGAWFAPTATACPAGCVSPSSCAGSSSGPCRNTAEIHHRTVPAGLLPPAA